MMLKLSRVYNAAIENIPRLQAAAQTLWNIQMARKITALVHEHRSDIYIFTTPFPSCHPPSMAGRMQEVRRWCRPYITSD